MTEPVEPPGTRGLSGFYTSISTGLPTTRPGTASDAGWTGLAFGDFTNDGLEDLVTIGRKGDGPEVFLQSSLGNWTKSNNGINTTWSGRSDVRTVDLDKDGNLDFISAGSGLWKGDGTGNWTRFGSLTFGGEDIDWGDFNGDGHIDLAVVGHLSGGVYAYFGDGNGTWTEKINGLPTGSGAEGGHKIDVADVNNDGFDDIVTTYWYSGRAYLSDGTGNWTLARDGISIDCQFYGVQAGDLDKDGNLDIVFGCFHNRSTTREGIFVYKGDGTGNWTMTGTGLPTTGPIGPVRLADLDDDGYLDIISGISRFGTGGGAVETFLNKGGFNFQAINLGLPNPSTDEQEGLDVSDIDGDGFYDVGIPYYGPTGVEVWRFINPTPMSINLTSPNGGEKLRGGEAYEVMWSCLGGVAPVKLSLEYTLDGPGSDYTVIVSNMDNDGSYEWTVPRAISTECLMRVVALDACPTPVTGSDRSNETFEIFVPPLQDLELTPEGAIVHINNPVDLAVLPLDSEAMPITQGYQCEWSAVDIKGNFQPVTIGNLTTFLPSEYGTGQVQVNVTYFGTTVSATCDIFVPDEPMSVEFDREQINITVGQEMAVEAFVYGMEGENMTGLAEVQYTWSMTEPIAGVVDGGAVNKVKVHGTDAKSAMLKCKATYHEREAVGFLPVNIYPVAGSIEVQPSDTYLLEGEDIDLTLTIYDTAGETITMSPDAILTWTLDGDAGALTPQPGLMVANFEAAAVGEADVDIELDWYGTTLTTASHILVPQTLHGVNIAPEAAAVYVGEAEVFEASAHDIHGDPIDGDVEWSWNLETKVGRITDGKTGAAATFSATKPGATDIFAGAHYFGESVAGAAAITVPREMDSIELRPGDGFLVRGDTLSLEAMAFDKDENPFTEEVEFAWEVTGGIGTVEPGEGNFTALFTSEEPGAGNVKVTVTHYSRILWAAADVTVVPRLDHLVVVPTSGSANSSGSGYSLLEGTSMDFGVTAVDDQGNSIDDGVEFCWKADGGKVTTLDDDNTTAEFEATIPGAGKVTVTGVYQGVTVRRNVPVTVLAEQPDIIDSGKGGSEGDDKEGSNTLGIAVAAFVGAVVALVLILLFVTQKKKAEPGGPGTMPPPIPQPQVAGDGLVAKLPEMEPVMSPTVTPGPGTQPAGGALQTPQPMTAPAPPPVPALGGVGLGGGKAGE